MTPKVLSLNLTNASPFPLIRKDLCLLSFNTLDIKDSFLKSGSITSPSGILLSTFLTSTKKYFFE